MEQVIYFIQTGYQLYFNEVILVGLVCAILLMITTIVAVKKCRKQIHRLSEKTTEMAKLALSQAGEKERSTRFDRETDTMEKEKKQRKNTKAEEELFGSVIQEIFP